jgi:hypothetical protein
MPIPQITIPGLSYNVNNVDIGQQYAQGITAAGKSLASAIGNVMGSVDSTTGETREGILSQNQTATDLIEASRKAGLISGDVADSLHGASLGAKQKWWGAISGTLAQKMAEQAATTRQQISEQGATTRQQISEQGATQRSQAQIDLDRQRLLLEKQPISITTTPATPATPTTVPKPPVLTRDQAVKMLQVGQ